MYLVIIFLLFNKASSRDAFILFVTYSFYQLYIVDLSAIYYYSCDSLLVLCMGIVLHHRNKPAAICAYLLCIVNVIGFMLWYWYLEPTLYDTLSSLILAIQLITILPRGLADGIRGTIEHIMVKFVCFNRV